MLHVSKNDLEISLKVFTKKFLLNKNGGYLSGGYLQGMILMVSGTTFKFFVPHLCTMILCALQNIEQDASFELYTTFVRHQAKFVGAFEMQKFCKNRCFLFLFLDSCSQINKGKHVFSQNFYISRASRKLFRYRASSHKA